MVKSQKLMVKKQFILIQDFNSPFMTMRGYGHRTPRIEYVPFRKGQIITGELHLKNGKPAFIMVNKSLFIPLDVVKEVSTKSVAESSFDGTRDKKKGVVAKISSNKFKYIDAAILGAIIGFGINYYGEKKAWFMPNPKNKFIAIGLGAAAAAYLVYRFSSPSIKVKKDSETN